jgi:hypothetical protein
MPIVLVPLATLVIVLWVLACAAAIAIIMGYVSDQLSGLPWPLDKIAGPVSSLAQGITNVCGKLEAGVDHLIGVAWHLMARYLDREWQRIEDQASLTWHVINGLVPISAAIGRLDHLVHSTAHGVAGVLPRVKTLEREYHGIEKQVKTLEHDVAKGIGHDVLPRIRSLDKRLGHVIGKVIPAIEAADAQAEKAIGDLWKWARQNTLVAGSAAFAGAVAIALSTLGLGGLRCNTLLNSLTKRGCGLWNGLEDVLGLLFDAAVFTDLCQVIPLVEGVFAEFEGPLVELVSTAANAACAHPPSGWVTLPVTSLSLPSAGEITGTL